MNIKLADRLVELRKENKLSQEALAEKLGLSRQAISKWERAEASPDTDNLIALAELYNVSLDTLLGNEEVKATKELPKEKQPLTEKQEKGREYLKKTPIALLIAIAVYVVGGIIIGGKWWAVMWILFPLVIAGVFASASMTLENKKFISIGLMTLAVTFCAVAVFALFGMLFGLWNVAWIVFLVIPAYLYLSIIKKK